MEGRECRAALASPIQQQMGKALMEGSYERLIAPIQDKMIRCIWRIVHDPDDADDAMQEALTSIWRRLDRIEGHPNPQALILRICVNASYDVLRKRMRRPRHDDLSEAVEALPDRSIPAPEALSHREQRAEILAAISQLPRNQAAAAVLRLVEEQPFSAVAEALQCTEGTARTHVKRARERLARTLAHLNPFPAREASKS